ncbi:MAG TPA: hypothetical protein P5293_05875 [Bacteroidales bacterium]|nr:hypothetical protein [Bacteroidales bacterium]
MKKIEIVSPKEIHQLAKEKGWWDEHRPVPELLCLLHSEISEALEAYRNDLPPTEEGGLFSELADSIIRIFDMCGAYNIDIAKLVEEKHKRNMLRPYRHGNKKC